MFKYGISLIMLWFLSNSNAFADVYFKLDPQHAKHRTARIELSWPVENVTQVIVYNLPKDNDKKIEIPPGLKKIDVSIHGTVIGFVNKTTCSRQIKISDGTDNIITLRGGQTLEGRFFSCTIDVQSVSYNN